MPLSTILIFDYRIVPTVWYFRLFILLLVAFCHALYIFHGLTIPTKTMKFGIPTDKNDFTTIKQYRCNVIKYKVYLYAVLEIKILIYWSESNS